MKANSYIGFKHSGVVTDLPAEEVTPKQWTSVVNMQFQDGATRRVGGYADYGAIAASVGAEVPIFAYNGLFDPVSYWLYCTATRVFVTDGTASFDITPVGGLISTPVGKWTGCTLNGIVCLSNGRNAPMYWAGSTGVRCQSLPGWPVGATCKAIRAFKYHLLALGVFNGTADFPNSVWWSAAADPGAVPAAWTPSASNDAGDMDLGDTPGVVVDGLALRDLFIVYKEYATYAISYVAGPLVFTSRKLFLTSGVQALNCIAEVNGVHFVFTGLDVIRTDGQNTQSLCVNKVRNSLVKSIDPAQEDMTCVVSRQANNQVWVCIPEQGGSGLTRAYVINTLTEDIGVRELPGVSFVARGVVEFGGGSPSWASDTDAWNTDTTFWAQQTFDPTEDSLLMVDPSPKALYAVDVDDTAAGAPVAASCERQSLPIGDKVGRVLITRVIPRIEGEPGDVIRIQTGGQAFFGEAVMWSEPQDFVIGSSVGVSVQTEGRLVSVRFAASTLRQWKIHSYRLGYVERGLY